MVIDSRLTIRAWTPSGSSRSLSKEATQPPTRPHSSGSSAALSATVVMVATLPMLEERGPFLGGSPP